MLLRHWNFYESISNSNYTVSKLNLWKEPGQKQLKRFLAQLGLSLDEAKQNYNYIDPKIRSEIKEKILNISHDFGLDNIMMSTYVL